VSGVKAKELTRQRVSCDGFAPGVHARIRERGETKAHPPPKGTYSSAALLRERAAGCESVLTT